MEPRYDGTGVGVAIIDSGVHLVDDLKDAAGRSRVVYQQDFTGGNSDDAYGHGTHVAGIIAGNGKSSTCSSCKTAIRGVAPAVTLINFRALDKNGAGTDSAVISAINQAIARKSNTTFASSISLWAARSTKAMRWTLSARQSKGLGRLVSS